MHFDMIDKNYFNYYSDFGPFPKLKDNNLELHNIFYFEQTENYQAID